MRQGRRIADNIIASLRHQPLQPYVHRDLGLVVDLGGKDAVSKPLGVETARDAGAGRGPRLPLVGAADQCRQDPGHDQLDAQRDRRRRLRTHRFPGPRPATLRDFEYTDSYLTPEQIREHTASI